MNYLSEIKAVQEQLNTHTSCGFYKRVAMPLACGVLVTVAPNQYRHFDYAQLPAGGDHGNFMGGEAHLVNVPQRGIVENEMPKHEALAEEFQKLVIQWKEETVLVSSSTKLFSHPAYVRIMAMGTAGLPLVFGELKKDSGRWFYALKFMAGEGGKDVAAGIKDYETAKAAWLEWGYKNNYI